MCVGGEGGGRHFQLLPLAALRLDTLLSLTPNYLQRIEEELNDICLLPFFQKQTTIMMGDLNMDRLKLHEREGKILRDIEEVNNLQLHDNGANQDNYYITYTH